MPRAAGSGSHYEFVLRNSTGSYDRDTVIRLPSITHIISATLNKPLDNWVYRTTRDGITGFVSVLNNGRPGMMEDILDTIEDPDMLAEYLKENRLRPEDVANDASERGTREHEMLQHLADAFLESDEVAAEQIARRTLNRESSTPWAKAISAWWLERYPRVQASEMRMYSLALGCAGTCDLIWENEEGDLIVTDLKTRTEGKGAYRSDYVQVEGYATMYEEMTGLAVAGTSVLVVRDDTTYDEYDNPVPRGTFAEVKRVYDSLKGVK